MENITDLVSIQEVMAFVLKVPSKTGVLTETAKLATLTVGGTALEAKAFLKEIDW